MDKHPVFEALRDGQPIFGGTKDRETGRRFVLDHGKSFTPAKLLKGMRRRKEGTCYESAAKFILHHRSADAAGFRYVEGFAMRPALGVLMAHAWIAHDGQAFDLTWRDLSGGSNLDCLYFGVEFPASALGAILSKRGYYGLLDPADNFVLATLLSASALDREAA